MEPNLIENKEVNKAQDWISIVFNSCIQYMFYDFSFFITLYKWMCLNLSRKEVQTIKKRLGSDCTVFQSHIKECDNVKILIKYIRASK